MTEPGRGRRKKKKHRKRELSLSWFLMRRPLSVHSACCCQVGYARGNTVRRAPRFTWQRERPTATATTTVVVVVARLRPNRFRYNAPTCARSCARDTHTHIYTGNCSTNDLWVKNIRRGKWESIFIEPQPLYRSNNILFLLFLPLVSTSHARRRYSRVHRACLRLVSMKSERSRSSSGEKKSSRRFSCLKIYLR